MEMTVIEESGVQAVEGAPGQRFMATVRDVDRVIEACFEHRATSALLYAANLTDSFFDLSSGDAGAILQKLRNYHIRLAVVRTVDDRPMSSRFGEVVHEEQRGGFFGVFETRDAAMKWLSAQHDS